jgi:hypothetical protein
MTIAIIVDSIIADLLGLWVDSWVLVITIATLNEGVAITVRVGVWGR